MQEYEITYLVENEEVQYKKSVEEAIKKFDGKITSVKNWGQRNLAYPIKKLNTAFYVTIVFEMVPDLMRKLNRELLLDRSLLRFLIVRGAQELEPERPRMVKREAPVELKTKEITKSVEKVIEKKTEEKAEKVEKKEAKKAEKKVAKPKAQKKASSPKTADKKPKDAVSDDERLKQLENKLQDLLKE